MKNKQTAIKGMKDMVKKVNVKRSHPKDCQCIECVGKLFGEDNDVGDVILRTIDKKKKSISHIPNEQDEIRERSKRSDIDLIENSKMKNGKYYFLKNISSFMEKILIFLTAFGIFILCLSMIIRSLIKPNLISIISHVLVVIVLVFINEHVRKE